MDRPQVQLVQVILLFAAVTCIEFVDSTDAPAQEIFCSIPPAKQAERGTITCCFKNVPISNASMTVNARGVKLADSETVSVLALEFPNTDHQKMFVNEHFEFENVSSSDGVNWNVSVHIPKSTQAYQGDYYCQLVGANAPSPATCHFILDTLSEQVQNTFVSLRVEPQNVTDVEDKYTIRRVDLKSEGSDTNTSIFEFDPPVTNVSLTSLNNDTKYEVTVYLGKPLIPVTRSICIPTVRKLRVETLKSNKQGLDWDQQPVCQDSVAYRYKVCYEEADPDVPRNHQCFYR
ncbi:uncharacterized protein [Littorina saxatilis]|uniref:uncharacterized protein n=1 Tax=Littorina saxatilis TaxID=31220 RepID=UPI0038B4B507